MSENESCLYATMHVVVVLLGRTGLVGKVDRDDAEFRLVRHSLAVNVDRELLGN